MRGAPGDHGKNRHDDTRNGPDHDFNRRGVGPLGLVVSFGIGCAIFPRKRHDHEQYWNHNDEHQPRRREQQSLFLGANISLGRENFHVAAAKQHDRADAKNAR
ncbi:hypothetical protein D3C85_1270000 [compost metagenome]